MGQGPERMVASVWLVPIAGAWKILLDLAIFIVYSIPYAVNASVQLSSQGVRLCQR